MVVQCNTRNQRGHGYRRVRIALRLRYIFTLGPSNKPDKSSANQFSSLLSG